MEIRLATRDDFKAIDEFDIFLGNRMTEIERSELWVAVKENVVIAYISFNEQFYTRPFVHYLNVRKEYRRSGTGRDLMLKFEELYRERTDIYVNRKQQSGNAVVARQTRLQMLWCC